MTDGFTGTGQLPLLLGLSQYSEFRPDPARVLITLHGRGRCSRDRANWRERPSDGRRRGQAQRRAALQRLLRDPGWHRCACGQTSTLGRMCKRSLTTLATVGRIPAVGAERAFAPGGLEPKAVPLG